MKSRATYKRHFLYTSIWTLLLLGSAQVDGQSISRQVIGITGGEAQLSNTTVSWTVGEPFIGKATSPKEDFVATVGFQQPSLLFIPLSEADPFQISIAPNPTQDYVTISQLDLDNQPLSLSLTNSQGQVLIPNLLLQAWKNEIDVSRFPAGTYFIQVKDESAGLTQAYKIIKY